METTMVYICRPVLRLQLIDECRNVEIDAIETPSQMQEKWVYDPRTFNSFARHWLTGEPVPDAVFKQIAALQKYRAGMSHVHE